MSRDSFFFYSLFSYIELQTFREKFSQLFSYTWTVISGMNFFTTNLLTFNFETCHGEWSKENFPDFCLARYKISYQRVGTQIRQIIQGDIRRFAALLNTLSTSIHFERNNVLHGTSKREIA